MKLRYMFLAALLLPAPTIAYEIDDSPADGYVDVSKGGTGAGTAAQARINLGLGNVNNTSDAGKPVSTATQAALNLKADKTNVLELDNTTEYTPDADYEPATKKYVDDNEADTVGALSCSSGQVTKWNGSAWACADDAVGAPGSGEENVQADWDVSDTGSDAYILNKPALGSAASRQAEDTLTNGANLPDGAAIIAYGDANWSDELSASADETITGAWTFSGGIAVLATYTATAANSFSAGDIGYLTSAGTVSLCDASAESTTNGFALMATESISGGASGVFALSGAVTVTSHGLTIGAPIYISETAGDVTTTAPATSGAFARVVGYATSANIIRFSPSLVWVEVE